MDDDFLRLVADLASPERRAVVARSLAAKLGAEDMILFVRDQAVSRSLPAPGFPQTLRGAREWRDLVDRAVAHGTAEGQVRQSDDSITNAWAMGLDDGTVLVLTGASAGFVAPSFLRLLLPLVGAHLRIESVARNAVSEAAGARQSAVQSAELAAKLDTMRGELQQALSVAEKATRARDEFLATVSHELRTPLTSIIGWLQLLREDNGPDVLAEGLDTIDRNARAQSRLIEDILDFSRINAGKMRLDVRPTELTDVIRAAIDVVRPASDARGVSLNAVLDPAATVSGDPDRLQQIVWNLLSNAVKFTPRGGRVHVRLQRVESHVELSVSDTGEGIGTDFLPHVFDRFSQADSSSTRTHTGLGLGLGIVRNLVELHGGTVHAFSEGLGKGSTFTVRLPVMVAHRPLTPEETVEDPPELRPAGFPGRDHLADLSGVTVLLVEDNDDARTLLTTILKRCGARVQAASNAPAALQLLKMRRPDIIISDIEMPGEDGYSLIRKVRLDEHDSARIPAIALTAYTRTVDRVRALAAGFHTHMSKPVEPAELVAAVKSLVAKGS